MLTLARTVYIMYVLLLFLLYTLFIYSNCALFSFSRTVYTDTHTLALSPSVVLFIIIIIRVYYNMFKKKKKKHSVIYNCAGARVNEK